MNEFNNWYEYIKSRHEINLSLSFNRKDILFDYFQFIGGLKRQFINKLKSYKILRAMHKKFAGSSADLFFDWENFSDSAESFFETRELLDDMSKAQFDDVLLLRLCSFNSHYVSIVNFKPTLQLIERSFFKHELLASYYFFSHLEVFKYRCPDDSVVFVIGPSSLDTTLNNFHHYFPRRDFVSFLPKKGDIVFDCGACIGDMSIVYSAFVGVDGGVHCFDPSPLHGEYIKAQIELNPDLTDTLVFKEAMVSDVTISNDAVASISALEVRPGVHGLENCSSITLDDYFLESSLERVDLIKMDIEGSEFSALDGASKIIREFRPKLAVSVYHKSDDMITLRRKIQELNPDYKFVFEHHTPTQWESVLYAY